MESVKAGLYIFISMPFSPGALIEELIANLQRWETTEESKGRII